MRLLLFFYCLALFTSCYNVPCRDNDFSIAFVGFKQSEFDSVYSYKYKKGSDFNVIIDSIKYMDPNPPDTSRPFGYIVGDTTFVTTSGITTSPDFDYSFYFPSLNKEYRISDIVADHRSGKKNCGNEIFSFKINGKESIPQWFKQWTYSTQPEIRGYYFYIPKN